MKFILILLWMNMPFQSDKVVIEFDSHIACESAKNTMLTELNLDQQKRVVPHNSMLLPAPKGWCFPKG